MISPQAIAGLLGLAPRDQICTMDDLEGAISRGFSKQSLLRVIAHVTLNTRDAKSLRDQVIPSATWKRTKGRLSSHVSERTERLARVIAAAEYTWDDPDQARLWINQPHPELGDRTPLATAATELGARRVEDLLDRLFYGLPA